MKKRSMEPSLKIESELKIDCDGYTWVRRSVLLGDGLLYEFINDNEVSTNCQSGFRAAHNSVTVLLK